MKAISISVLAAAVLAVAPPAGAQEYPTRPIKFIIHQPPAGVGNATGRAIAKGMEEKLGQTIVIENKPGGSGVLGVEAIATSPPDGYTIGLSGVGPAYQLELMGEKMPFDFHKDLALIGLIGGFDTVLVARANSPVNTIQDLIRVGKEKPGNVSIGMAQATATLVPTAYLAKKNGFEPRIATYRGDAPANVDLLGGHVDFALVSITVALPHVKDKTIKPIMLFETKRSDLLPGTPGLEDAGVEGLAMDSFYTLVAPAATPQPIVQRLNKALNDALQDPAVRKSFADQALRPMGGNRADVEALVAKARNGWLKAKEVVDFSQYK